MDEDLRQPKKSKTSKSFPVSSRLAFRCSNHIREDHGQPIFGISFNEFFPATQHPIFATAGSNRVSVYRCLPGGEIAPLQKYEDPDVEEIFYTCCWSYDVDTKESLLIASGARGVIRVINTCTRRLVHSLLGHGNSINDLRIHPHDVMILLSSSKDHALRLWNVKTGVCVAILGGVDGHRDEVLSGDFDIHGRFVFSCGMDHALKMWSLETLNLKEKLAEARVYDEASASQSFPTTTVHIPQFSTRSVHRNYVDCVRWFGELVLSKSCENAIVLWKPGSVTKNLDDLSLTDLNMYATVLHQFDLTNCDIWFLRFCLDFEMRVLACGNQSGRIFLWDLAVEEPGLAKHTQLFHPRCESAVRHVGFSSCSRVLISVCDNGTIWRWDKK
ncbi:polycomb protein eed-like [Corticium candelabrum]|uniref:polycomb protein eed-like n=1 Tax=Corticium candelabrum TaxID=121492 RepID=UPI002E273EAB|nr:polycomb protein eed-like [Corticium candelabrum]